MRVLVFMAVSLIPISALSAPPTLVLGKGAGTLRLECRASDDVSDWALGKSDLRDCVLVLGDGCTAKTIGKNPTRIHLLCPKQKKEGK